MRRPHPAVGTPRQSSSRFCRSARMPYAPSDAVGPEHDQRRGDTHRVRARADGRSRSASVIQHQLAVARADRRGVVEYVANMMLSTATRAARRGCGDL